MACPGGPLLVPFPALAAIPLLPIGVALLSTFGFGAAYGTVDDARVGGGFVLWLWLLCRMFGCVFRISLGLRFAHFGRRGGEQFTELIGEIARCAANSAGDEIADTTDTGSIPSQS